MLQTKLGYQKKRKTMVFPPVCHTAVKLHHGDHQPSGQKGDISLAQWDISQQKNGDN
jgi:hypothetical protein